MKNQAIEKKVSSYLRLQEDVWPSPRIGGARHISINGYWMAPAHLEVKITWPMNDLEPGLWKDASLSDLPDV